MDIGIGLPATIPGIERKALIDWAKQAEARGFSTLGTIDRIVYGNYEPLVTLGAAAAVTERIRLATNILIAPVRANAALLAKQVATVEHFSGGRLTLGIAVGGRPDDYEASGVDFSGRGKAFDEMLDTFRRVWGGESFGTAGAIGPGLAHRPRTVFGGTAAATFRRMTEHGDGWIMGGGSPDQLREGAARAKQAWQDAGREGEPRIMALAYFALGDGARAAADSYLHDYYAFLGDIAGQIASSAAVEASTAAGYAEAFAAAGCDELIFVPCDTDPGQVDLLADAVL